MEKAAPAKTIAEAEAELAERIRSVVVGERVRLRAVKIQVPLAFAPDR